MDGNSKNILQDFLETSPIFAGIPEDWIRRLVNSCPIRPHQPGKVIIAEGDHPDQFYIILQGQVSVETFSHDGDILVLSVLDAPQLLGHFGLIDGLPRSASARVTEPSLIASMSKSLFQELCDQNRCVERGMFRELVMLIRSTNKLVEGIRFNNLHKRVAQFLLNYAREETALTSHPHRKELIIRVTQSRLAERVAGSREKVNGCLKKLEELGAIQRGRGEVRVLNLQILENLASDSTSFDTL